MATNVDEGLSAIIVLLALLALLSLLILCFGKIRINFSVRRKQQLNGTQEKPQTSKKEILLRYLPTIQIICSGFGPILQVYVLREVRWCWKIFAKTIWQNAQNSDYDQIAQWNNFSHEKKSNFADLDGTIFLDFYGWFF